MPSRELGFFGQQFMLWVLFFIPVLGIVGYIQTRRKQPRPPKPDRYQRMMIAQAGLLVLTVLAAHEQRTSVLFGPFPTLSAWVIAAAVMGIIGFRVRQAWTKLTPERLENARRLLPDDPSLMRRWVVVSAMAGITEECAYRGLAMKFLTANHGSYRLALLLCVVAFAIAHAVQGWRGILATAMVALLMHGVVYATGSLYLAIVFHAVYDLVLGVIAVPVLTEFARRPQATEPATA